MAVTINLPRERKKAGIPLECTTFCFCYPLDCLSGLYETLVVDEGAMTHIYSFYFWVAMRTLTRRGTWFDAMLLH